MTSRRHPLTAACSASPSMTTRCSGRRSAASAAPIFPLLRGALLRSPPPLLRPHLHLATRWMLLATESPVMGGRRRQPSSCPIRLRASYLRRWRENSVRSLRRRRRHAAPPAAHFSRPLHSRTAAPARAFVCFEGPVAPWSRDIGSTSTFAMPRPFATPIFSKSWSPFSMFASAAARPRREPQLGHHPHLHV